MELIVAITGASGVIYGISFLKALQSISDCKVHLIVSKNAKDLISYETSYQLEEIMKLSDYSYENTKLDAVIASGSKIIDGMVIIPCSMSTAAKINTGIADNLITRAADVCMKEQRKLIIVPRETPCNSTHLRNLLQLSESGVIVLPAMPGYYHKPQQLNDLVNFITGKVLDQLGIENTLFSRWSSED
jgi:4-hydroxy-3-polyprenylbenzoate decarboxylase